MTTRFLDKLDRRSAPEQVTAALRSAIVAGVLRPGERLPQLELAGRLGVSRMPVREALNRLEAEGLVVIHPHRGAMVSALSVDELREIYDIRISLETMALRLSIPRMEREDLGELERLLLEMDAVKQPQDWLNLNREFHGRLYRPSARRRLCGLIDNLRAQSERYLRIFAGHPDRTRQAQKDHWDIYRACGRRQVERAVALLGAHLSRTVDALAAVLPQDAGSDGGDVTVHG